jgi:hypothetical protein
MEKITEEIKDYIKEHYYYNHLTGDLWKKYKSFSRVCGHLHSGYLYIKICDKQYYIHRICWMLYYGSFPNNEIDHIDRNRLNNKLENLREATKQQNMMNKSKYNNNSSGFKGVYFRKDLKKWAAYIQFNKKRTCLGHYLTKEEASAAYQKKAAELFGEFNPQRL